MRKSFREDFFLRIFGACLRVYCTIMAQNWRVVSPYFLNGLGKVPWPIYKYCYSFLSWIWPCCKCNIWDFFLCFFDYNANAHSKRHLQIQEKRSSWTLNMPTEEKEGNGNSNLGWGKGRKLLFSQTIQIAYDCKLSNQWCLPIWIENEQNVDVAAYCNTMLLICCKYTARMQQWKFQSEMTKFTCKYILWMSICIMIKKT